MTIRILVTGSRSLDEAGHRYVDSVLAATFDELSSKNLGRQAVAFVHGAARGVDDAVRRWVEDTFPVGSGVTHEPYPAAWDRLGKSAGIVRNDEMVNAGAHLCLAFPRPAFSVGTWDCIRRAANAGIITRIYPLPDMS